MMLDDCDLGSRNVTFQKYMFDVMIGSEPEPQFKVCIQQIASYLNNNGSPKLSDLTKEHRTSVNEIVDACIVSE